MNIVFKTGSITKFDLFIFSVLINTLLSCPQKVSEDCLYLNIFVPVDVNFTSPLQSLMPVMVWIHGGDFIAGSASKPLYDGRFISNFTHTVVVNLEYRLGENDAAFYFTMGRTCQQYKEK